MNQPTVACPGCRQALVLPQPLPAEVRCPRCGTGFRLAPQGSAPPPPRTAGAWWAAVWVGLAIAILAPWIWLGLQPSREAEPESPKVALTPPTPRAPPPPPPPELKTEPQPQEAVVVAKASPAPEVRIKPARPAPVLPVLLDDRPRLVLRFHDDSRTGAPGLAWQPTLPSMRFGLSVAGDPGAGPAAAKRLTPTEDGLSNNTCLRLDGTERLFGLTSAEYRNLNDRVRPHLHDWPGRWVALKKPLGKDRSGRRRLGYASVWRWNRPAVQVTQVVELVPGPQSRLLDTCLVRYVLENWDPAAAHTVGLRFLLDTQIGANDGVPFLIPGEASLCDTLKDFRTPAQVPDYLLALEREDLADPGTVAAVRFKVGGGVEPPDRVTLGVWPGEPLRQLGTPNALGSWALWEVPVLPIKTPLRLKLEDGLGWWPDSAVTVYWKERRLGPLQRRVVGFSYGLGNLAAAQGKGKLALSVGGPMTPGSELIVTGLVHAPRPGETVTLYPPAGFQLTDGPGRRAVPPLPPGAARKTSPVTWKLRAGEAGAYVLRAVSSTGAEQSCEVIIREPSQHHAAIEGYVSPRGPGAPER